MSRKTILIVDDDPDGRLRNLSGMALFTVNRPATSRLRIVVGGILS
jgi:hypothetical protein